MRFDSGGFDPGRLTDPYVVVRWMDQWETYWEHKRGEVRRIEGSAPWTP